jgi:hypothetical protein
MKPLPSYEEIYEWLHSIGVEPLPAPEKGSTRKGIGRYLAACLIHDRYGDPERYEEPDWYKLWLMCSMAQRIALQRFHIRLPADTFTYERHRVKAELSGLSLARFMEQPDTAPSAKDEAAAYRWATRT